MKESEAIKLIEKEVCYESDCRSEKFYDALNMATDALEKQDKIKEAFTHYAFYGNEMNILNDCVSCFAEIKKIMEGIA